LNLGINQTKILEETMTSQMQPGATPRPTPLKALLLLFGAVLLVVGYIVLCGVLLGDKEVYAGFLFLLCWSALEHLKLERLPATILGAAIGLGLGVLLKLLLSGSLGATGGYIFGALMLPVVYCQLMGWLPLLINFTTMTFLAVTTIPDIQAGGDFRGAAIALVAGILYFGLVLGFATRKRGQGAGAAAGAAQAGQSAG
jgi:hypothetical protein